jgi:hypothetical protein
MQRGRDASTHPCFFLCGCPRLNSPAESFHLLNRDTQRVAITSQGMIASASPFWQTEGTANMSHHPGCYQLPSRFMRRMQPSPRYKFSRPLEFAF